MSRLLKYAAIALLALVTCVPVASARGFGGGFRGGYGGGFYGGLELGFTRGITVGMAPWYVFMDTARGTTYPILAKFRSRRNIRVTRFSSTAVTPARRGN